MDILQKKKKNRSQILYDDDGDDVRHSFINNDESSYSFNIFNDEQKKNYNETYQQ